MQAHIKLICLAMNIKTKWSYYATEILTFSLTLWLQYVYVTVSTMVRVNSNFDRSKVWTARVVCSKRDVTVIRKYDKRYYKIRDGVTLFAKIYVDLFITLKLKKMPTKPIINCGNNKMKCFFILLILMKIFYISRSVSNYLWLKHKFSF